VAAEDGEAIRCTCECGCFEFICDTTTNNCTSPWVPALGPHRSLMISRSAMLLLSAALVGCAAEGRAAPDLIDAQALRSAAVFMTPDVDNGTPLANPVSLLPLSADSVLVVDATDPFIRLYGAKGESRGEFGPKGQGPGEFVNAGPGVIVDGIVHLPDRGQGRIVSVRLEPHYQEVGRAAVPPSVASLFDGCGNIGGIVQLVRPERDPEQDVGRVQNYTIAVLAEGEWKLAAREWPPFDFVPSPPGFRVAVRDGTAAIYNFFHSRIELIDCKSGLLTESVQVPYPDWRIPPRPSGIAWIEDEIVLFFSGATRVLQDTTYVARWRPGSNEVSVQKLPGRFVLNGLEFSRIWLIDNTMVPTVLGVPADKFRRLLDGA
jgi:hypothetical protein